MSNVICAWCNSSNTKKKPTVETVKYEEYVCQDCHKSSWHQTNYNFEKLPNFPNKREFFMLEPDCFPTVNQ